MPLTVCRARGHRTRTRASRSNIHSDPLRSSSSLVMASRGPGSRGPGGGGARAGLVTFHRCALLGRVRTGPPVRAELPQVRRHRGSPHLARAAGQPPGSGSVRVRGAADRDRGRVARPVSPGEMATSGGPVTEVTSKRVPGRRLGRRAADEGEKRPRRPAHAEDVPLRGLPGTRQLAGPRSPVRRGRRTVWHGRRSACGAGRPGRWRDEPGARRGRPGRVRSRPRRLGRAAVRPRLGGPGVGAERRAALPRPVFG